MIDYCVNLYKQEVYVKKSIVITKVRNLLLTFVPSTCDLQSDLQSHVSIRGSRSVHLNPETDERP